MVFTGFDFCVQFQGNLIQDLEPPETHPNAIVLCLEIKITMFYNILQCTPYSWFCISVLKMILT